MSLRIVGCGGGNPTTTSLPLFEAGLNLSGAERPNILVVPTAKFTRAAHDKIVAAMRGFGAGRGLEVGILHGFDALPTPSRTAELLEWADVVYAAGGNTRHMMNLWKQGRLVTTIRRSITTGQVVWTGVSAGFLAIFSRAHSDSESYEVPEGAMWDYMEMDCIGILDAVGCPHYDTEHKITKEPRKTDFRRRLRKHRPGTIGVGADNSIGMQIVGDEVSVLSTGAPGFLHRLKVLDEGQLDSTAFPPSEAGLSLSMFLRAAA